MPLQNYATPMKLYELRDRLKENKDNPFLRGYKERMELFDLIEEIISNKIKKDSLDLSNESEIKKLKEGIKESPENKQSFNKYSKGFEAFLKYLGVEK